MHLSSHLCVTRQLLLFLLIICVSQVLFIGNALADSTQSLSPVPNRSTPLMSTVKNCPEYLHFSSRLLHSSKKVNLCELAVEKTVLLVNTASHCGFTKHFKALESLHQKYHAKGLVVVGFPSDDFFQENDSEAKAADICFINFGVTFTMLAPSNVRGDEANSVFKFLADKSTSPKWNFYKYLVNATGERVEVFSPFIAPDDPEFITQVESMLGLLQ